MPRRSPGGKAPGIAGRPQEWRGFPAAVRSAQQALWILPASKHWPMSNLFGAAATFG